MLSCKAVIGSLSCPGLGAMMAEITVYTAEMMGGRSFTVVAAEFYQSIWPKQCDAVSSSSVSTGQIQH